MSESHNSGTIIRNTAYLVKNIFPSKTLNGLDDFAEIRF